MINPFKYLKAYLSYKRAVALADKQHKLYGSRQYVIGLQNGKLVVGDKKGLRILQFRSAKSQGEKQKQLSVKNMESSCFYHTPYPDGKHGMRGIDIIARRKVCLNFIVNKSK